MNDCSLTGESIQSISAMVNRRRPIDEDMAKRFANALRAELTALPAA